MTFQLDTSGAVEMTVWDSYPVPPKLRWSDLTPFAQGFVEGLFASGPVSDRERLSFVEHGYGFKHLHPEALALILRDCAHDVRMGERIGSGEDRASRKAGRKFWLERQTGNLFDAPPLHRFLSEDGRVCLRPATEAHNGAA